MVSLLILLRNSNLGYEIISEILNLPGRLATSPAQIALA